MDKQMNRNVYRYKQFAKLTAKLFAILIQLIMVISVIPNWNDIKQYLLIALIFGSWINILGINEKLTAVKRITLTVSIIALAIVIAILTYDIVLLRAHQFLPPLVNATLGFMNNLFLYSFNAGVAWWSANKFGCFD